MEPSASMAPPATEPPYELLLRAAISIPFSHYLMGFLLILLLFLYNFLEMHFLQDFFTGFSGQPVILTFNASSHVYREVASKCKILHGRFLPTPWLCSPHLQTMFVHYFGNPPVVNYRRQIFVTSDGGTLAWDWVINPEYVKKHAGQINDIRQHGGKTPIIIIVPGLTSASDSAYVKHLAFKMAKHGNVVVGNHRGLGGIAVTSDCFYNGGWTEDVRTMINHLHGQYPESPLFVIGTSIGANILVKYLGEDGINTPIIGAAAICCPWDLLICDKFMSRRLVQRCYNKALTIGLKEYAYLHEAVLSRLANWEGVKKSRWVREFDDSATRVLGKFETVDTYYRKCSSSLYVGRVMVPLLCVSSLDDPVCTSEAIPFDECRLNDNVVLATTLHGGHLPFFEGLTARSVWWVRAVDEFFGVLLSSPLSQRKKEVQMPVFSPNPQDSSIDHVPYVHVTEDGMLTGVIKEPDEVIGDQQQENADQSTTHESVRVLDGNEKEIQNAKDDQNQLPDTARSAEHESNDLVSPIKKSLHHLSRQNQKSLWLLAYIAVITTWPVLGSALAVFFRKKFQNFFSTKPIRK